MDTRIRLITGAVEAGCRRHPERRYSRSKTKMAQKAFEKYAEKTKLGRSVIPHTV